MTFKIMRKRNIQERNKPSRPLQLTATVNSEAEDEGEARRRS